LKKITDRGKTEVRRRRRRRRRETREEERADEACVLGLDTRI